MKIGYIFIGFVFFMWLYTIVVTEPPYMLDRTPPEIYTITLQNVDYDF